MSDVEALRHYLARLVETPGIKAVVALVVWLFHLLYGPSPWGMLSPIITLWMLDWASGTLAAWCDPGTPVKSRRWWHALLKIGVYMLLLAGARQMGSVKLVFVGLALQSLIEGLILATEGKSLIENLARLNELWSLGMNWLVDIAKFLEGKQKTMIPKGGTET